MSIEVVATSPNQPKRLRCWEVDFVRGLCIIYVAVFHLCFDVAFMFEFNSGFGKWLVYVCANYYFSAFNQDLHFPIVFMLFFVSGISRAFTRSDTKRFAKIALCAFVITVVTAVADNYFSRILIVYGVLHTIALSVLLFIVLDKLTDNVWVHTVIAVAATAIGLYYMYTSVDSRSLWMLLQGNAGHKASPGDYFPLMPYFGFYIFGTIFGKLFYKQKTSLTRISCPLPLRPVCWCGKYSLHIYLASQAVFVVLIALLVALGL